MDYSPWSSKNLIDRNRLKKFVQVGIDIKCMHTNFGGRDLHVIERTLFLLYMYFVLLLIIIILLFLLISEVTKCLCGVFLKSVFQPILIKDKFAMELVTLVTLLHQTIGTEIGKDKIIIVIHFEQKLLFLYYVVLC